MTAYLFRRALWLVPILLVVTSVSFLLVQVAPGSPQDGSSQIGAEALWEQSLFTAPEDGTLWQSRFGYSAHLLAAALLIALLLGAAWGVLAALRPGAWYDRAGQALSAALISVPGLVLAALVVAILAAWGMNPQAAAGWEGAGAWILPAVVLGAGAMGYTARLLKEALLQVLNQNYALSVRARGAPLTRHLLRNALIPVVRALGPALSSMLVGSILVETMFGFPGMGQALAQAIMQGDRALMFSAVIVYAMLAALANLGSDVLAAFLDPRLRSEDW